MITELAAVKFSNERVRPLADLVAGATLKKIATDTWLLVGGLA